ncbi:MAG: hypothetical protein R3C59_02420 [Planctomycetaceae bacterium]
MARIPRRNPTTISRGNPVPGRMDTIYAGKPGRIMDTIYAGKPGRMDTIYAGKPGIADTLYGGAASGALTYIDPYKVKPGSGPVSVQVIHPQTRQAMTVMYNPATKLYLDNKTKSWKPAPTWMRSQIR